MLFNNLEEFLTEQTKEKPATSENITASGDDMLLKARAKEYFINSAHEIILVLRKQLEADGLFQYLPISHLDKIIMNAKQELTKSYASITESIKSKKFASSENDSADSKQEEDNEESVAPTSRKGKRGKNKIPKKALLILKNWLTEHFNDPYPNYQEKVQLSKDTGMTLKQVQIWFINARGRIWRKSCNPENFSSLIEEKLKGNESLFGDPMYKSKGPFN